MTGVEGALPHGAVVKRLRRVVNERGNLLEVQRSDDDEYTGFGQTYVTVTYPGVVRAWYRHLRQADQLIVVHGEAQLVLYDDRPESPTVGTTAEVLFGEASPALVVIPPRLWHGFRPLGNQSLTMLHLNDTAFDHDQPDEERVPIDSDRIPFRWSDL